MNGAHSGAPGPIQRPLSCTDVSTASPYSNLCTPPRKDVVGLGSVGNSSSYRLDRIQFQPMETVWEERVCLRPRKQLPWWEIATRRNKYRSCPVFQEVYILRIMIPLPYLCLMGGGGRGISWSVINSQNFCVTSAGSIAVISQRWNSKRSCTNAQGLYCVVFYNLSYSFNEWLNPMTSSGGCHFRQSCTIQTPLSLRATLPSLDSSYGDEHPKKKRPCGMERMAFSFCCLLIFPHPPKNSLRSSGAEQKTKGLALVFTFLTPCCRFRFHVFVLPKEPYMMVIDTNSKGSYRPIWRRNQIQILQEFMLKLGSALASMPN